MEEKTAIDAPTRRGGCKRGCAFGCLGVLIVMLMAALLGVWLVRRHMQTVMTRFERAGYTPVYGQFIVVDEPITNPTIFVAQTVRVNKGSTRGLAFLCQRARIRGHVVGNVHFKGQELTVDRQAVLDRDLDALAQRVNMYGIVNGKITGYWQQLHHNPLPNETPEPMP